jgi:beta-lactam-binding protein with PASTA domain
VDKKKNTNSNKKGIKNSLKLSLVAMLGICVAFYFLFFSALSFITGHGAEAKVPKLEGLSFNQAQIALEKAGFEVQIDSTYSTEVPALTVIRQQPEPGEIVKPGRTIFITINKINPPLTPMPNLNGLSLRSATMILMNSKLVLGDTSFTPDIAKGAILEQWYEGRKISPGELIAQGSKISLVIGDGLGNTIFDVPDIVGMNYLEAVATLSANNLNFTAVANGAITDTSTAIVYMQMPSALNEAGTTNKLREGDEVGFHFKQNPTSEELIHNNFSQDNASN